MTRYTICSFFIFSVLLCPAALQAQGVGKPKITNIPGGFFVEWDAPVDLAGFRLDKKMKGTFEVMFDVPNVNFLAEKIDKKSAAPSTSPDMVTVLADYWMKRGKPDVAISLYETCLKQGSLDADKALLFQNNLAMLYSQSLGQHDKALEIVDSALLSNKDNVTLLDTKGLVLLNSGKPAEARPALERAVELSCQAPIYCMHLAQAFYQMGDLQKARQWLERASEPLSGLAPKMGKENKAMYDSLLRALPPVNAQ